MTPTSAIATRASYDGMAAVYDRFTAHHDYEAWTATLEGLARTHGLRGRRLLDAGCGTGKSFLPFLRRGYEVTAFDLSPAMAAIAAAKAPGVPVHVHDVAEVPVLGSFDLVCCLDDCLNHLLEPERLVAAFARIAANLAPDGLVVFDVNTLATYGGFFSALLVDPSPDEVLVWTGATGRAPRASTVASATLAAYRRRPGGSWDRIDVTHRQRHYTRPEVAAALGAAGLAEVAVYGQGLDGRPEPGLDEHAHTKAVYLARHAR